MAKRRRGFETLGDMVRSLGVVLAVVLVTVLITIRTQGQSVRVVDYSATLTEARRVAPFTVLAPEKLPAEWRATSGDYSPSQVTGKAGVVLWHLGFVTPAEQYAGMEQSNDQLSELVKTELGAARQDGTSTVNGVTWQRWSGDHGRRAITLVQDKVPIVIHGTAQWAELEQLAGALRAG